MLVSTAVHEVMSESVATVRPDDPVLAAAKLLTEPGVNVVVVTDGESPVGVITVTDVIGCATENDLSAVAVEAVMSSPAVTVEADASIEEAADTIREAKLKRLPVVEDGTLAGLVTVTDLAYYLPRRSLEP